MLVPSRLSKTHKTCMYAFMHFMPCVKSVSNPKSMFNCSTICCTYRQANEQQGEGGSHEPDKIRRPFPMETKGGGVLLLRHHLFFILVIFGTMIGRMELVKL